MSIFNLSKFWSWFLVIMTAAGLATAAYFLIFNKGVQHAEGVVAKHNEEVVTEARKADDTAIQTIVREKEVIRTNTQEIKDVIRTVPDTGLNPVSRARLERVREQQLQAESEAGNSTN